MALVSPGVQVQIIDESIYAPTAVGTVPYILIATAENKTQPGSSSLAEGTLAENAGRVYNITSQRDLVTTFGAPYFENENNTPVNGSEKSEYGLMAAYSALAVCNSAYVQRADVDLSGLTGSATRPTGRPDNGIHWFDSDANNWGIYEWNSVDGTYDVKTPILISQADTTSSAITAASAATVGTVDGVGLVTYVPSASVGSTGDYAVIYDNNIMPVFKKFAAGWRLVGSNVWKSEIPMLTFNSVANVAAGTLTITARNSANVAIGGTATATITANSSATVIASTIQAALTSASPSITGLTVANVSGRIQFTLTTGSEVNVIDIGGTLGNTYSTASRIFAPAVSMSPYNNQPRWGGVGATSQYRQSGSVWFKTSRVGNGLRLRLQNYTESTDSWNNVDVSDYRSLFEASYRLDASGGGRNIEEGKVVTIHSAFDTVAIPNNNIINTSFMRRRLAVGSPVTFTGTTAHTSVTGNLAGSFTANTTSVNVRFFYQTATSGVDPVVTSNITIAGTDTVADVIQRINNVGGGVVVAGYANQRITLTNTRGGDILIEQTAGNIADVGFAEEIIGIADSVSGVFYGTVDRNLVYLSGWSPLSEYQINGQPALFIQSSTPDVAPTNNTLWYYDDPTRVDILIKDAGRWRNYRSVTEDFRGANLTATNESGPILSASEPTSQTDETPLVYGDLWIDTGDLENFPVIYRWQSVSGTDQWVRINNADSESTNGIIFADARWGLDGSVDPATDMLPNLAALTSNMTYVDLDAPDPELYPEGMLLFNTRASGYGIKQYRANHFAVNNWPEQANDAEGDWYDAMSADDWQAGAWVTVSGVDSRGLTNFGRKAQRGFVVAKLKAAIDSSDRLREEQNVFNIICCPGYPELIPNMVALNSDREETAFVIGDAPLRLPATGTAIQAWSTDTDSESIVGDAGLKQSSPYAAVYYPHAQANDLSGNTIVVPASHVALRTMIRSDNASYPWFAPAGSRRGLIDNASAIGFIDGDTGRFVSVGVTQGLRDAMYNYKINPLTVIPGAGLMVYGQKTLSPNASSLDRINVARLVNYVRRQLNIATRPFLFEPNDTITRNNAATVVQGFLVDLVAKRGIYDFVVVCDDSNNTSDRVARNELYIDVAIQPVKAVEFIYIPIRLKNIGDLEV
jgi:hypothetical protein